MYRYWTIGVVAALNKAIVEDFGAHVLAPPYERVKLHKDWRIFSVPVGVDESVMDPLDTPTFTTVEKEDITLEKYRWAHPLNNRRSFGVRIGVGRKTKTLLWYTPEEGA